VKGGRGLTLFAAVALLLPGAADAGLARWGFRAGAVIADHSGSDAAGRDARTTAGGGFVLSYEVSPRLGIEWNLLYSGKGSTADETHDVGGTQIVLPTTLKLSYIEIPVLAVFRFPLGAHGTVTPRLSGGPAFGILWECKASGESGGITFDSACSALGYRLHSADLGFSLGGGTEIAAGRGVFVLEARYVLGLLSIDRNLDLVNRALSLSVGYVSPIGKPHRE
jgi:hypothetical protein